MKLIKKSVSLLLVLCMIISLVPMNVFATTGTNDSFGAADGFYKIVHLDAGRKYISVANVKKYIDAMASEGYNQLTLYFSDNQGFRFKLNDMSLTVNGTDYTSRFESTIGNGYNQPADGTGTGDWFRHSLEPDGTKNYYTEDDMTEIITYANSKGIDLVPAFDMPGHMGAILEVFTEFRYTGSSTTSWSTLDVDNETARDFALAILQKYVNFFEKAGCDYFSICADEFCYDTGAGNIKTETLANIMLFMDEAAQMIDEAGMVPRCFNDWLYSSTAYTPSADYGKYEVYYWGNRGYATPADLVAKGHPIINTGEAAYYALGSNWYSEAGTDAGVKAFNPYVIATKSGSFDISNPAGVCFAIWCDRGYFDAATANTGAQYEPAGGDGGTILFAETEGYLRLFAQSVRERGPQEVNVELDVGETYSESFTLSGAYTADQLAEKYNFGSVLTATNVNVTGGDGGSAAVPPSEATELVSGKTYVFSDGNGNYLTSDLGSTTVASDAGKWVITLIEGSSSNYYIQPEGSTSYLSIENVSAGKLSLLAGQQSAVWTYDSSNMSFTATRLKQWWPEENENYVLSCSGGTWAGVANSTAPATLCNPGTAAVEGEPAVTTFSVTGAAAGSVTFIYNSATYTFTVAGEHTHDFTYQPATCQKPATCSCGAESGEKNPDNHVGTLSTANCTVPATYSVCKHTVGSTNAAVHTGNTVVRDDYEATETTEGYTGNTYCADCNTLLSSGTTIPVKHTHSGGVATCTTPASCTSCGESYGSVDLNNHVGDRKVTGITATFTGNIICVSCGNQVEAGTAIANDPNAVYISINANGTATHTANGELVANGTTGSTANSLATYAVTVTETTTGGAGIAAWESGKSYAQGDLVEYQGNIFYRKYGGSDGTPDPSAQYGAWGLVKEWTAGGYESNTVVSYNGEYYKASGWAGESTVPGVDAVWVKLDVGSSEGSGETETKTTITFTAGATNGNDEVTIGGQKFIVTVTGGNDPIIDVPECDHEWELMHDSEGHWNYCAKCETSTTKEDHTGGTANCYNRKHCVTCGESYGSVDPDNHKDPADATTHPDKVDRVENAKEATLTEDGYTGDIICGWCGEVRTPGEVIPATCTHETWEVKYDDTHHWNECTVCHEVRDQATHDGTADCQHAAHCSVCGQDYGTVNPNNHVNLIEVEGTYVAPTDTTDGKEADKTCTACGETVTGAVIPALNSNVVEITVAVGGTHQFVINGKDATGSINRTGLDENIATVSGVLTPGTDPVPEVLPPAATELVSGNTYVFSDGNGHYLKSDLTTTTVASEAGKWVITLIDGTTNNYYIQPEGGSAYLSIENVSNGKLNLLAGQQSAVWTYDSTTKTFAANRLKQWYPEVYTDYVLSFSNDTFVGVENSTAPATLCTPGTPAIEGTDPLTTITFTGVTEGYTYVTVDGTRYKINVIDAALMDAKINAYTWTTNREVFNYKDADGNSISFNEVITAADNINVATEDGVALADLVPARGQTDMEGQGTTFSEVVYWRGMRHAAGNVQGKSTDFHQVGDRILYIRYLNGKWEGSADRTEGSWLDLTGYTLDVYYLQETAVTKEVITEVVDWGVDYDNDGGMWEKATYVLLDFAVALDGVGRHPTLSGFPNAGTDDVAANQKTIAFHCATGWNDEKVAEGTYPFRRVDTIYAEETMQYEVYMITVTRTDDNPAVTLGGGAPSAVGSYAYNGEEKIIWTIDEATFNEKVGQTTTDGKELGAFELRPAGFDITSTTQKYTMYRTVGGRPVVDYVQIYKNQGLLVTYYVRAKRTEDSLTVHYRMEGQTDDFHEYHIAVQEGTHFNPAFNDDVNNSETGLVNNTLSDFHGNTHIVTSDLSKLFDIPAEYRTGLYQFNQHIDFILVDGTQVNQEDYTEDMGDIKEVILYYGIDNTHFVPVDFGHHLTIDKDFFLHHADDPGFTVDHIVFIQDKPMSTAHTYGHMVTNYVGNEATYSYVPDYIIDGHEDAYSFDVYWRDSEGILIEEPERHYVVFFPATTVYYEEFFLRHENALKGNWQLVQDGTEVTWVDFDHETDHQQDMCHADTRDIYNYGRDDGINRENGAPSNGTELVAKDKTAYAEFEITGTGVEIYANCSLNSSNAAVMIYSGTGSSKSLYKMFIVDTRLKEDVNEEGTNIATDATKNLEELGTVYNAPIVTVTDMPYGTYTVRIGYVTSSDSRPEGFRFDGFRVLEPLQDNYALPSADGLTAGYVYNEHFEYNPTFFELRDAVLAQAGIPTDYDGDYAGQIAGDVDHQVRAAGNGVKAVIIGSTNYPLDTSDKTVLVDMLDNSAKNEIYLWPGQAIVFKMSDSYHMQVGMRAVNSAVNAKYYVDGGSGRPVETTKTINTTTDMFYPMIYRDGSPVTSLDGNTVVITNASTSANAVLAITMLKCLPDQLNSGDFLLDLNENDYTLALTALGYMLEPEEDIPDVTEPEETEPEETEPETTEPEVTEPEVTEPEVTEPEVTEPEVTTPDVEFVGATLSLKGDISLNFYVKLSEKILSDETAYMQFTVGGTTRTVALSDGILDESDGSYRFSVAMNAKNMGDAVIAQVYNEDGAVGASKTLSIKDYADYAIKNSNKGQLVKLMKAMLNYGAAAQIEFGYNLDNLVNADLDDADKVKPGTVDVGAFQHTITGTEDGIQITSASLLLQSETKIRIYFTLAEGKSVEDYTFTIDGKTVAPVKAANGEYYLEKANVAAKDLDSVYTFQLGGLTLTYSGMSYINQVQNHSSNDVNLMNLAKTLYEYCQAANVYFG